MMKNKKELTFELSSYFLLFVAAIIFRLVNLYLAPLADSEALITLQAVNLVRDLEILKIVPDQILLVNGLAFLFTLFGSQASLVRLLPALAGALLVFLPYIFRNQLGRKTALGIAVWLTFDPLFYLLSRKVDSTLFSIGFLFLALYTLRNKKWIGFGCVMALGVLSGAPFFIGLVLFGLTSILSKTDLLNWDFRISREDGDLLPITAIPRDPLNYEKDVLLKIDGKLVLTAFVATLVLAGTLGFMIPSQFGGVLSGLVNFVTAHSSGAGLPLTNLLTGLLFYEFIILMLGGVGLFLFWKQNPRMGRFVGIWLGLAFLFVLIYPARSVSHWVWLIFPLGCMANWLLVRVVHFKSHSVRLTALFSVILFVFLVYIFMLIFSTNLNAYQMAGIEINNGVIAVISIIIFILAVVMIGWAWSWNVVKQSLLASLTAVFMILMISAAWDVGGGRDPYHNELWHVGLLSPDMGLIQNSIKELTAINGNDPERTEVYLQGLDSPALLWELRNFDVRSLAVLPETLDTEVVITAYESEKQVVGPYRGQDYLLTSTPAWNLMTIREWKHWILTRQAPQDGIRQQLIIVWFNNQWFAQN